MSKPKRTVIIAGGGINSLLAALHALAPGVRDLDALDAIEKDDERMREQAKTPPPTDRKGRHE